MLASVSPFATAGWQGNASVKAHRTIFAGDTRSLGKIVSVFEPHTEIIRKGK
jgi:hypothetical protein